MEIWLEEILIFYLIVFSSRDRLIYTLTGILTPSSLSKGIPIEGKANYYIIHALDNRMIIIQIVNYSWVDKSSDFLLLTSLVTKLKRILRVVGRFSIRWSGSEILLSILHPNPVVLLRANDLSELARCFSAGLTVIILKNIRNSVFSIITKPQIILKSQIDQTFPSLIEISDFRSVISDDGVKHCIIRARWIALFRTHYSS